MNDFQSEPVELRDAMLNAVRRVLDSGWYVLGPEVSSFEELWSKTCGVGYGIGVGNGMDALEIALRCLDVGPGDEVITTPMTAFATILAILRAGATPVLADIVPETGLLALDSVRRCINNNTKAIINVHLYGQLRNMPEWAHFCETVGIYLIEDCAQSHLAVSHGQAAGSFGIAGAYSFYPTKNLGAVGDAGMLVTRDAELAARAVRFRNYGQSERYQHPDLGMNSRLDELQAAILTERYKWLSKFTDRRRQIAKIYQTSLNNPYVMNLSSPEEPLAHSYHLYVVLSEYRDGLQEHLKSHGIQSLCHYPLPIHKQPPCKAIKRDKQGLKASEEHAGKCLSLPCHPQMADSDVEKVTFAVNSFKAN